MTATPLCTQAQFAAKACPANTQVGTTTTPRDGADSASPSTCPASSTTSRRWARSPRGWASASLRRSGDEILLQSIVTVRPDGGLDSTPTGCRGPRPSATSTSTPSTSRCSARRAVRPRASSPTRRRARSPPRRSMRPPTTARRARARRRSRRPAATSSPSRRPSARPSTPAPRAGGPRSRPWSSPPPGQANARSVQITLPAGLGAAVTTLNHACPQAQFDQGTCAPNAQIGTAKAETPALAAPLAGPGDPGQARRVAAARAHHRPARPDRPEAAGDRRLRGRRAPAVDARRPARHRAEPLHADARRRPRRPAVQRARPLHRADRARRRDVRRARTAPPRPRR